MKRVYRTKSERRARRHARVRAKVSGQQTCPRLSVFRSLRAMNVQLIDDTTGQTLISVHTKTNADNNSDAGVRQGKIAQAYRLGKALGEKAKLQKITIVVFDRGGYRYHGRVRAVAEGARDSGLVF